MAQLNNKKPISGFSIALIGILALQTVCNTFIVYHVIIRALP